jgi:hypothetical protein
VTNNFRIDTVVDNKKVSVLYNKNAFAAKLGKPVVQLIADHPIPNVNFVNGGINYTYNYLTYSTVNNKYVYNFYTRIASKTVDD